MLPRESRSAKVQQVSFAFELPLSQSDLVMAARGSSFSPGPGVALRHASKAQLPWLGCGKVQGQGQSEGERERKSESKG